MYNKVNPRKEGINMEKNHRIIQSLQRAFAILDCFDELHPRLSLNDITEMVHLNINTTRGLVNTLVHFHYLSHDSSDNSYCLGLAYVPKAELVEEQIIYHTKHKIQPFLKKLSNEYLMSVRLNMISSGRLFTLYTEVPDNSRYLLMTRSRTPFPLHATSSGKAYLSTLSEKLQHEYLEETNLTKYTESTKTNPEILFQEMQEIKKQGYALEIGEISDGIGSIAFPILNRRGDCFATISLSSSNEEILEEKDNIAKEVKEFTTTLMDL